MFGIHQPEAFEGAAAGLDSSAAMVRAEADHLQATLHALVTRLSTVPGLDVSVSYRHGRLRRLLGDLPYVNELKRKSGPIQRIVVVLGPHTYWLRSSLGTISCGRDPISPREGPAGEELTFSVWAKALLEEIARHNIVNHDSLVALRHLVERDRVD